jgi:SAM-dependent methyltransferase
MPDSERIVLAVQARYQRLAEDAGESGCCGDTLACGPDCYDADVAHLPAGVTDLSLGCGDPISLALLQPGQTVLDLGAGAGIDCFLAAERVGPTGAVIGIDMTPAMLEKANRNRERLGVGNVSFRLGRIEDVPLASESVDVVISNCVINLSPDKAAVFSEAFRVLKPGGRLAVTDMVTLGAFTEAERADLDAWSACVSGALPIDEIARLMAEAGFVELSLRDRAAPQVELIGALAQGSPARLFSARITGRKPSRAGAES